MMQEHDGISATLLDDKVPNVSRVLRRGRSFTRNGAAKIARAVWLVNQSLGTQGTKHKSALAFWAALGREINGGTELPATAGEDQFKRLFLDWILPPPPPDAPALGIPAPPGSVRAESIVGSIIITGGVNEFAQPLPTLKNLRPRKHP